MRDRRSFRLGALGLAVAVSVGLGGCRIDTTEVLTPAAAPLDVDAETLAARAEALFEERPRSEERVREAFRLMSSAAQALSEPCQERYTYLWRAARYAVWLAGRDVEEAVELAEAAVVLTNTAIAMDSSRVEGWYTRAIAIGHVARHDRMKGRSAMAGIRRDASRALEIDAGHDEGGPHRVLGALYLRAPGPPAGVGSLRRALHHLEAALEIAPDCPENRLFLAEAYLEAGRPEKVEALLEPLVAEDGVAVDRDEQGLWRQRAREMLERARESEGRAGLPGTAL